jgi:hypothetical protein
MGRFLGRNREVCTILQNTTFIFTFFEGQGEGQKGKIISKWRTAVTNFLSDFCNVNTTNVININLNCTRIFKSGFTLLRGHQHIHRNVAKTSSFFLM